jgi:alpha-amylase/alpha-mannosidase (GH57 family)
MTMSRCVCIHGHFYQPPRENPWLELVERQESASPWHDWNERITAECYRRNTASRILDNDGNIRKICNNYSRMSFNIGPTLLSWMKSRASRCYREIVKADAEGLERFSGHGPALAQVYSHMIMPLANRRDKVTQVRWGIQDFKSHFGRMPEGMWLAETAVDTETLEVLAENGIRFTLLAPKQASEVRRLDDAPNAWRDVKWEKVDTGQAYRCNLPSGRHISLFFYDGGIAQAVAFGGLLFDGGYYAQRLIDAKPKGALPSLSHVATDGESYGHHHQDGDMALSYCLETIDTGHEAELTIYGEFLEKNPPLHEVRIVENSSWSCAHGIERWRSDCGCSGGTPGFHQKWRAPLREALDWLRDKLAAQFEREGGRYLKDPWGARDEYIAVILDRTRDSVERWIGDHASRPLTEEEKLRVLKLMESQRAALLMYTSCGWFFDDISSLETVQILRYAARAADLIRELTELDFELKFARLLEKAPSNVPELKNGKIVYELLAKPARVSFGRLAAHYGMSALLADSPAKISEGCWDMTGEVTTRVKDSEIPHSRAFAAGEVEIASHILWEKKKFIFAVNYRGDTSVLCGVVPESVEARKLLENADGLRGLFTARSDEKMVECFGSRLFSLRHILQDAQKSLLDKLLHRDITRIENSLHDIVQDYDKLLEFLRTLGISAPAVIRSAAGITLTADVIHGLEAEIPDVEGLRRYVTRARQWNVPLDDEQIGFALSEWVTRQMVKIHHSPANPAEMERVCAVLTPFLDEFKWRLSLYEAQNLYHATQDKFHRQTAPPSSPVLTAFRKLGKRLRFSQEALI